MERPLTVSGLIDKRRTLAARLKVLQADVRAVIASIDSLDTVLRLFDAEVDLKKFTSKRLPSPHWATKGELQRLVFQTLQQTGGPITSAMMADSFCNSRGIELDSPERDLVRQRISCSLGDMHRKGYLKEAPAEGRAKGWVLPDDD